MSDDDAQITNLGFENMELESESQESIDSQPVDPDPLLEPSPADGTFDLLFGKPAPTIFDLQYSDRRSPQFSILHLFGVTAVCFASLVLMTGLSYGGPVILFAIFFVVGRFLIAPNIEDPVQFRAWNHLVWGIIMPIVFVYFVVDVARSGSFIPLPNSDPFFVAMMTFMGWQVIVLIGSWFVRPSARFLNYFVSGTLFVGGALSFSIAVALTPFSIVGCFLLLVGLPGFTPYLTGNTLVKTAAMHQRWARDSYRDSFDWPLILGAVIAIMLGLVTFVIAYVWNDDTFWGLEGISIGVDF